MSFYGDTLALARKAAASMQSDEPVLRPSTTPTVAEWLAAWLEMGKDRLDPQTWRPYELHARRYIVPSIGNVKIDRLTDHDVDRLHRYSRKHVGASTAHHIHATLSSALSAAQKRGLIRVNVAKQVPPPRRAPSDIQPYTPEQVQAILYAARDTALEALFVLAVTLGPRLGELLALRWQHVDLARKRIRIVASASQNLDGDQVISDTKTAASNRTLQPLPAVVIDALERTERTGELVWPAPEKGGVRMATTVNKAWKRLAEAAGVPHTKFHNLRHTAATIMLDEGVAPHVVSAILGHASVAITLQLYAHVTKSGLDSATAALDARYATS